MLPSPESTSKCIPAFRSLDLLSCLFLGGPNVAKNLKTWLIGLGGYRPNRRLTFNLPAFTMAALL
jgi:hypothetical protein